MAVATVNLRRLLDRGQIEDLFAAFARMQPASQVALFDTACRYFAGDSRLSYPAAHEETSRSLAECEEQLCLQPLEVEGLRLGMLVGSGMICGDVMAALHRSLTVLLSQTLQTREVARETLERYREINLLYRIGESIGSCLDPDAIPDLVLEQARTVLQSDLGLVLLETGKGESELAIKSSFGDPDLLHPFWEAADELIRNVGRTGRPDSALLSGPLPGNGALCAPLKAEARVVGFTLLGRAAGLPMFTASDQKLLLALADQASIALERALLHRREVERSRLEQELSVGRRIQLSLLPAACPDVPGWEFASVYQAAEQVGGDYYDFFTLPGRGRRMGLAIGDITGKGIPAALMMAHARALLRSEAMGRRNPATVLTRTNQCLVRDDLALLFLTMFYSILDLDTGRLTYASGGHDHPLWLQPANGTCTELAARSTILGAFPEIALDERRIRIAPGDALILYTDGVTDMRNERDELFDLEGIRAVALANQHASAGELLREITLAAHAFAGDVPPPDDFTLVVIRRVPA